MNGKTVIRFSEHILCKLPSMAGDATLAFAGDVRAWIHTSERVVEAMGSTISMCIQHHSIRKLTKEVQAETQNMQEQLNTVEHGRSDCNGGKSQKSFGHAEADACRA